MSETDLKSVKLPYFHRTLSPEDAALIGDTTPKPIHSSSSSDSSRSVLAASAWNSAQTWEERDCSSWGKTKIRELFTDVLADCKPVAFSDPSKVEGHANITHVRGRARFLYEWSFSVVANVFVDQDAPITLSVEVSEVINDQLDDIILEPSWNSVGLSREAKKGVLERLRSAIIEKIRSFERQFQNYQP